VATYYVHSTDGDDGTGDGSQGNPYKTIAFAIGDRFGEDDVTLELQNFGPFVEHDIDLTAPGTGWSLRGQQVLAGAFGWLRTVVDGEGLGSYTVRVSTGTVERLSVIGGGSYGILSTSGATLRDLDVDGGTTGIHCNAGGPVQRVLVRNATGALGAGIKYAGTGSLEAVIAHGNAGQGIWLTGAATAEQCVAAFNGGQGIYAPSYSSVARNCIVVDNADPYGLTAGHAYNCLGYTSDAGLYHTTSSIRNSPGFYEAADCIEANPLFVDGAGGDFRLGTASPGIHAGTTPSAASSDYLGADLAAPPSIGAYEWPPLLASVTPADLTHVEATFDAYVDPADLGDAGAWSLAPDGAEADVVVTGADAANDGLSAVLTVHPRLTAGGGYVVTFDDGDTVRTADLDVPSALVVVAGDVFDEFPIGLLETITHAVGQEVQVMMGGIVTRLVADLDPSASVALVESTFGWPDEGAFFVGGWRFAYSGRSDGALTGIDGEDSRVTWIPRGAPVRLDASVDALPPAEG
jgi:hypothetical protein